MDEPTYTQYQLDSVGYSFFLKRQHMKLEETYVGGIEGYLDGGWELDIIWTHTYSNMCTTHTYVCMKFLKNKLKNYIKRLVIQATTTKLLWTSNV